MKDKTAGLLMDLVTAIGNAADHDGDSELSLRLAQAGAGYKGDLMIVGRAVNGWGATGWTPAQLRQKEFREEMVSTALADAKQGQDKACKLAWVSNTWGDSTRDYNPATSAFWRAARGLIADLSTEGAKSQSWSSSLAWSNLYKIAPKAGGNPKARLARQQVETCKMLLADELIKFRPRRLIFLTGYWWAEPFLSLRMLEDESISTKSQYIHRRGLLRIDGESVGRYVVADHPQGKKEQTWLKHTLEALS